MDKLPFFYYDILSRIIPGATTLATLFLIADKLPPTWSAFFAEGMEHWKAVVVPLLLGGLCYVIGVLFEVADYTPLTKWLVLGTDAKAFRRALAAFGEKLEGWSAEQVRLLRFHLWETCVFEGGRDADMGTVFAHCHRFQAEYKMFLHLIYPVLLFAGFSIWSQKPLWWVGVDLAVIVILFYLSYLRNERRWLQALSFCKHLNILEKAIRSFEPQQKAHTTKATH